MTIFLEIAKQCLSTEITLIIDTSLNADQSYLNGALGYIGYGRNTVLSLAKRQLLGDLLKQIQSVSDEEKTDEQHVGQLYALIKDCRLAAAAKSAAHDYGEGSVGPALQGLRILLEGIFDKLAALQLLDTPHDTDPFNGFRYYIAHYCSNKIKQAHKTSDWGRIPEDPNISITRRLMAEKEALIVARLNECKARLDGLKDYSAHYQQARIKMVLDEIRALQRDNLSLYANHGVKPGMPIRFSLFGVAALPTTQSAGGTLDEALRQATAEITRNMELLESAVKQPAHLG